KRGFTQICGHPKGTVKTKRQRRPPSLNQSASKPQMHILSGSKAFPRHAVELQLRARARDQDDHAEHDVLDMNGAGTDVRHISLLARKFGRRLRMREQPFEVARAAARGDDVQPSTFDGHRTYLDLTTQ